MSGHVPVLLEEVVKILKPRKGKVIVDCTVGLGGHAAALRKKGARVIGLDLDPANLARIGEKIELHRANFAALPSILAGSAVDGILADLGVSSPHLDDSSRGFSYRESGPLDMRLDPSKGEPAAALLDRIGRDALARAILELGDEEDADRVADAVVARRPLRTTLDLAAAVCEAKGFTLRRAAGAKLHPAARTFQAVRMLVNREMPNLERLLAVLPECLKPKGIAAIISFHSGEDRRVKRAFREGLQAGVYDRVADDPIVPKAGESEANPRARSAKLRWARKAATKGVKPL